MDGATKLLADQGKMTFGKWGARIAALIALLFATMPASAAWRKAETANFILYSEASEEKVREQAALLEDYHWFLRLLTAVDDPPAPNKLRVYLMRSRGQLRQVRDVPEGVKGFYTATPSGIAAFVDDGGGTWGGGDDEVLFHEIAHHFMLQYRPVAYPAWFVEGFAEYVMTTNIKGANIDFGLPSAARLAWLKNARWLPFERVLFEGSGGSREERSLFYAQSWLLAHYLMRDEGRREKFKAYVTALNQGVPPLEAFTAQFGDVKSFGRAVEAYARRDMTYSRFTRKSVAAAPAIRLVPLPASAEELLPSEAALYVGQKDQYAQRVLAKVRAEAAKHPGDAYARRVLATAEVLHGDPARGEALLDELLKASPEDADLLYLKGMRYVLAGRADEAQRRALFKQARPWFVKVHKADPNHWRALARYGESLTTESSFATQNTLDILLKAQQLAPQVAELTMNAANLLLVRGHPEEAEALILPLASHPHNSQLAADAQALLARARAAKKPATSSSATPAGE